MKILVIESSPHRNGSSNLLASSFIKGAEEAGHEVSVFDAGHSTIHPCLGCDFCAMSGPCCQKDDMARARELILGSDMLVLVTPLYYFGFSAQLKNLIDRFYSFNGELSSSHKKSALIAASWDSNEWTMKDISSHYQTLCRYLHFSDQGMVLGTGCGTVAMTRSSAFMKKAYELGRSLK